jgi:succinoglycan biosynthesis transport protein ExoP
MAQVKKFGRFRLRNHQQPPCSPSRPSLEYGSDRGKKPLEEVIWIEPTSKMAFLPAVVRSRLAQSNEILSSPGKKLLLSLTCHRLLDRSPAMTHPQIHLFLSLNGVAPKSTLWNMLPKCTGDYDNLLGVVLSKVDECFRPLLW